MAQARLNRTCPQRKIRDTRVCFLFCHTLEIQILVAGYYAVSLNVDHENFDLDQESGYPEVDDFLYSYNQSTWQYIEL